MKTLISTISILLLLSLTVFIKSNTKNNGHNNAAPAIPKLLENNIADTSQTTTTKPAAVVSSSQPAKGIQAQLLDTDSSKVHLLSADNAEQVWIDEANQQLVVKDMQTNKITYQLPLSADLIAINLSSDSDTLTEYDSEATIISDNVLEISQSPNQANDELEIYYDQQLPDEIIIRNNGVDEFVSIDQLEDNLDLLEPILDENSETLK